VRSIWPALTTPTSCAAAQRDFDHSASFAGRYEKSELSSIRHVAVYVAESGLPASLGVSREGEGEEPWFSKLERALVKINLSAI
jgi:hypothetical protein